MIESLAKDAFEENKILCSSLEEFIATVNRMARGDIFEWCLKFGKPSLSAMMENDARKMLSLYQK